MNSVAFHDDDSLFLHRLIADHLHPGHCSVLGKFWEEMGNLSIVFFSFSRSRFSPGEDLIIRLASFSITAIYRLTYLHAAKCILLKPC